MRKFSLRKQSVTWILLWSLGLMITGISSCQPEKQKPAKPSNVLTKTPQPVEKKTDGNKTATAKTAPQRREDLGNQAKTRKPPRRKDTGYLTADKTVHDFGIVEPRARLQGKFVLKNDGKETLKIRQVHKSCGCLTSKLKTKILEPGQSVPLTVTFTTSSVAGKETKTLRITTEPPTLPETLVLRVTAQVKRYVEVIPSRLELKLRGNEKKPPSLVVKSTDNKPFQITSVRAGNKTLELVYDKKKSATQHTITVKPKQDLLKKSAYGGIITLQLNHPSAKSISVPYRMVLPYAAHPTARRFTTVKPGQPAQADIDIVSNYGEAFELGEIKSEKGYIKVLNTVKVPKGYKMQLEMSVPPNSKQRMPSDYLNVKIKDDPVSSLRILCYSITR